MERTRSLRAKATSAATSQVRQELKPGSWTVQPRGGPGSHSSRADRRVRPELGHGAASSSLLPFLPFSACPAAGRAAPRGLRSGPHLPLAPRLGSGALLPADSGGTSSVGAAGHHQTRWYRSEEPLRPVRALRVPGTYPRRTASQRRDRDGVCLTSCPPKGSSCPREEHTDF